jgi:hypothetical protein
MIPESESGSHTEYLMNTPEPGGEPFVETLAREHGINLQTVLEIMADLATHWGSDPGGDGARQLLARYRRAMQVLVAYQDQQKELKAVKMSTRLMCLALGFDTAAGADNPTDIGRNMGFQKATANKCLNLFLQKLELPPRVGQRNAQAKENMRSARLKQLKPERFESVS